MRTTGTCTNGIAPVRGPSVPCEPCFLCRSALARITPLRYSMQSTVRLSMDPFSRLRASTPRMQPVRVSLSGTPQDTGEVRHDSCRSCSYRRYFRAPFEVSNRVSTPVCFLVRNRNGVSCTASLESCVQYGRMILAPCEEQFSALHAEFAFVSAAQFCKKQRKHCDKLLPRTAPALIVRETASRAAKSP